MASADRSLAAASVSAWSPARSPSSRLAGWCQRCAGRSASGAFRSCISGANAISCAPLGRSNSRRSWNGRATNCRPPGTAARAGRACRRRPAGAAAGVAPPGTRPEPSPRSGAGARRLAAATGGPGLGRLRGGAAAQPRNRWRARRNLEQLAANVRASVSSARPSQRNRPPPCGRPHHAGRTGRVMLFLRAFVPGAAEFYATVGG